MISYILGSDSITIFFNGNSFTINKEAQIYNMVVEAVSKQDEDMLHKALNMRNHIITELSKTSGNLVLIEGNRVMYGDREITGLVASRVFEMIRIGMDINPMIKFIENLMGNPSKRAVDELFGFLDACNLPITPDGYFLAYKRVRDDFKDCYSGTMDNSVGKIVSVERNAVDDDKDRTCSYGLHACSYSYLKHFNGARIVVVKINPADVVSVPVDYNNAKLRCCKYEVVDEIALNEYNLPSEELDDGYTDKYYDVEVDEEEYEVLESEQEKKYNPSAKLNEDQVREIREAFMYGGYSVGELAVTYKISQRQVKRIINFEAWRDV